MTAENTEIIVLGTGPTSTLCPFTAETWGVNGAYAIPGVMDKPEFRIDKMFMSDYLWFPEGGLGFDIEGMNGLIEKFGTQLISLHRFSIGKFKLRASIYPFKRVAEKMGTEFFTNTIAYMIAYALYKNTTLARNPAGIVRLELTRPLTIRLYGVDMLTTREYLVAKGGVEFWIAYALGLGATVDVPKHPSCAVMVPPQGVPYGWERKKKLNMKNIDPYNLMEGGKSPPPTSESFLKWTP